MDVVEDIRSGCAWVAAQSTQVRVDEDRIATYAADLANQRTLTASLDTEPPLPWGSGDPPAAERREWLAAYWLTLDAVNFGSGWFPTLLKMPGMTGYRTIKAGIDRRFRDDGPWSAGRLRRITVAEISTLMMQQPDHPLMALFKASLRDLGTRVECDYGGEFTAVVDAAHGSAVGLAKTLARWDCFADSSAYRGRTIPFLKRAQLTAADLARAHVAAWTDLDRLTLFADNLVPHVLRLDGVLSFDPGLTARIEAGEPIEHGSPEEVEMRACAVTAVERLSARTARPAWLLDELLWNRGQQPHYKSIPRPRSRSTAY